MRANRFGAALALVLLTGCLTPPDRGANLQAIARWQDQRLAPADSLRAMLADGDAHVRLAAVRAAGLIGRDDVMPELLDLLDDPSLTVGAETAWAIGLIGHADGLPALSRLAGEPRPQLREAAVMALGQLPNDGTALLAAAAHEDPTTAALAWNGLRNQATRVDPVALRKAIVAGLARPEADVLWRVLRCAELRPDTALVRVLSPFTRHGQIEVAVHAYRALARQEAALALPAILAGLDHRDTFHGRAAARLQIAVCRALGAAGPAALLAADDPRADRIAAVLISAAGAAEPQVAGTALAAMAQLVQDQPLPPEAADQESLLPVWRIRLTRSARAQLASPHVGVRAAAVTAIGALRGAGAASELQQTVLLNERSPHVLAAAMPAIAAYHPAPVTVLAPHLGTELPGTAAGRPALALGAMVRAAALTGLAEVRRERPEAAIPPRDVRYIEGQLLTASTDPDFVVATTAAGLLGAVATDESLLALTTLWDRAAGGGRFELQRGALAGLAALLTPAGADSTAPWQGPDELRSEARRVLRASFDSPDLRLRREGRQAALATGLLPATLIPSEGSLLATLPAVQRDPRQPPVAVPFAAPAIRCVSERGDFVIELDGDLAPNTCALFLDLVRRDYFGAMTFHRVVPDFVVQGGDPEGNGWGGPGFTIRSEWSRARFDRGTVGIAHDGKDTGGSQFFVALSPQPHLNGRYTVFGHVRKGMAIVDQIEVGDTFRLELMD